MSYTKEPWPDYIDVAVVMTPNPDGPDAAVLSFNDYHRARACVNACAGIPTSELEAAARDGKFLHAYETIRRQRDELLAVMNKIPNWIGGDWDEEVRAATLPYKPIEKSSAE